MSFSKLYFEKDILSIWKFQEVPGKFQGQYIYLVCFSHSAPDPGWLGQDAERFLRLQVGMDILKLEIENFRRKNQDPVFAIASRLFAELTMGSFAGLKTDVDDRGEPILVGLRADSRQTLGVEAMSTGSRDQLYLALRLAGLGRNT